MTPPGLTAPWLIQHLQDDIKDEKKGAPPKMRFADGKVYVYKPKD